MQTVAEDVVAGIKRRHRDLNSDGVRNLATVSRRGRLKEDLESSTWLLLGMWCMYDACNEPSDCLVARYRLEIDGFDETAHAVIVMFDETSEE
nr:hypothetical protein [Tanacetum cinerariifolium]